MSSDTPKTSSPETPKADPAKKAAEQTEDKKDELGGPKGPEPTRFGDWEQKGRCTDF